MSIKEIEEQLDRPCLPAYYKRVLEDIALEMRVYSLEDSAQTDKQALVALIQKDANC